MNEVQSNFIGFRGSFPSLKPLTVVPLPFYCVQLITSKRSRGLGNSTLPFRHITLGRKV